MGEQEDNFNKLVECAEEYIVKNAEKILIAARIVALEEKDENKTEEEKEELDNLINYTPKENEYKERCKYLLASYKPMCNEISEINFDKILERFCIELQNYQAMPRAINYASYDKKNEESTEIDASNNEIYEIAKEFHKNNTDWEKTDKEPIPTYHFELYKKFKSKFEENKVYLKHDDIGWYKDATKNKQSIKKYIICEDIENVFTKDNNVLKYNYAWHKYTHGLMDVLIELKPDYEKFIIEICEKSDKYYKTLDDKIFKELKTNIENFHKNIFGISDTLSYDFFKELYCTKLIKDDVHILECWKHCIDKNADIKSKRVRQNIVKSFISFCKDYEIKHSKDLYTPYYIDKLLWLCCTGNFYEDGIIISKMNRTKFFDYFDDFIKNNNLHTLP